MKRRTPASEQTFEAELLLGHKGVVVVVVPFNPESAWSRPPSRLAGRRHGWPVTGTVSGLPFEGFVGERWNRFFIIVEEGLREVGGLRPGDRVTVSVAPTSSPEVLAKVVEQSKQTTQPAKARPLT